MAKQVTLKQVLNQINLNHEYVLEELAILWEAIETLNVKVNNGYKIDSLIKSAEGLVDITYVSIDPLK